MEQLNNEVRPQQRRKHITPWAWVPSLYFAEGIPYVTVMTITVIMYKKLGISNADIAFYTGWLYLPWVIKPIWSPIVDLFKSKRWWIIVMQSVIAIAFAGIAFSIPVPYFFQITLAFAWLLAFSSATHDIAADGFYMLGLSEADQSRFVGIRSTFYRAATVFGQGLLVILAGLIEKRTGDIKFSWVVTFAVLAVFFLIFAFYHGKLLPVPAKDESREERRTFKQLMQEFFGTFVSFFKKKGILPAMLFLLTFRLPEAFVVKMINPFLLDPVEVGGLGLATAQVGLVYGTYGIIGLTLGGILGGLAVSKGGLKKWLWPMLGSLIIPCLVYVYLAYAQPTSMAIISFCIVLDQFGYGFGFTAYMLFMMYFSQGKSQTAHYAICTGFMALSMMLPGMVAGYIQEAMGYLNFFWFVISTSLFAVVGTLLIKVDPKYGVAEDESK
ncbi:MAG: MFS transporter [Porphyromonas sp.]|nr:MFS transporter [Porphyromonas sp.]